MLLSEIAVLVDGKIIGNEDYVITDAAPLQTATANEITFLERPDRIQTLQRKSKAGAVVVPCGVEFSGFHLVQVKKVLPAFEIIVKHFHPVIGDMLTAKEQDPQRSETSRCVHPSAQLGENVIIGSFASIGENCIIGDHVQIHNGVQVAANCTIGEGSVIFPNVTLYRNTVIGRNCIIHANAVIGAFGFGYDSSTGKHILSAQLGNVVIGNDVEVGANSTIDRGTYSATMIGDGTKIDNLVMIAHNCKIGKGNLICSGTGIAGSTTTGDDVVMAGRVGVKDHIHIGDRAVLGAMSGVIADVEPDAKIVGIPATPEKEQMRIQIALQSLPEMRKEFKELKKRIAGSILN